MKMRERELRRKREVEKEKIKKQRNFSDRRKVF
jgi:hypothetical protein